MDITEPDAGSDMAALRAIGEQDEDGNWYVSGQKIFITSGHGKYHFVIARTEEAQESDDGPLAGLGGPLDVPGAGTYDEDDDGQQVSCRTVNMWTESKRSSAIMPPSTCLCDLRPKTPAEHRR